MVFALEVALELGERDLTFKVAWAALEELLPGAGGAVVVAFELGGDCDLTEAGRGFFFVTQLSGDLRSLEGHLEIRRAGR